MVSLVGCQHHGGIGGLLGRFCLQTLLLLFVYAPTRFVYQFLVLLGGEHGIHWIMSILFLYSDPEFGG